jgi:hypothetical protein
MITDTGTVIVDDSPSAMSWKAVLAGATAAIAVTMILLAFGAGVGFTIVSPWSGEGVSATTFTIAAGIYLVVVAMISSTIGGYLAGRLRSKWPSVHEDERYFRDSAHGFLVWALATVVSAVLLGGAATHLTAGASSGLAAGIAPAATVAAQGTPADATVDALLRTDPMPGTPAERASQATSPTPQDQQSTPPLQGGQIAVSPPAPRYAPGAAGVDREMLGRMITPALRKGGDLSAADRTYLARLVSARTGLPQAEAEQRVTQVMTQAKETADAARKSAAKFSLWLAFSMLAGALSGSLAAIEGGSLRNREWYLATARARSVPAE